jgi:WD40 repeat protein
MRIDEPGQLIIGCEWHISPLGRSYFVNHNTGTTSWTKPTPERPAGSLTPECVIEGHAECIWSLACVGSCKVMSASDDGSIRQWTRDGEPVGAPWRCDGGGYGQCQCLQMKQWSRVDGRIRLWNIKEGKMIGEPWDGHGAPVRCLDWFPNSREIANGSQDGTIRRWNLDTGHQIGPTLETGHGWV